MTRAERIVHAAEMLHWIGTSRDGMTVFVDGIGWRDLIAAIKSTDAVAPANAQTARFVCSGRSGGRQDQCSFTTDDEHEAMTHWENNDHDVTDTRS